MILVESLALAVVTSIGLKVIALLDTFRSRPKFPDNVHKQWLIRSFITSMIAFALTAALLKIVLDIPLNSSLIPSFTYELAANISLFAILDFSRRAIALFMHGSLKASSISDLRNVHSSFLTPPVDAASDALSHIRRKTVKVSQLNLFMRLASKNPQNARASNPDPC